MYRATKHYLSCSYLRDYPALDFPFSHLETGLCLAEEIQYHEKTFLPCQFFRLSLSKLRKAHPGHISLRESTSSWSLDTLTQPIMVPESSKKSNCIALFIIP